MSRSKLAANKSLFNRLLRAMATGKPLGKPKTTTGPKAKGDKTAQAKGKERKRK
jgi:hypothetical protein